MMTKDNLIGIDRLRLANVKVLYFDKMKFRANNGEYNLGEGVEVVEMKTGEIIQVNDFYINVEGFATEGGDNSALQLQLSKLKGQNKWTFTLGINAPKLYKATNIENISNNKEVENIPQMIQKHLEKVGVYVDLGQATVSYFEVNYNIHDEKFENAFRLINECWKMDNKKVFSVDTKQGYESLKLKLPTREIKVYNKVKQLEDTFQFNIHNDVIRVEVGTSHKTTIKSILGDDKLETLINNLDKIQDFYRKVINDNMKKPYIVYKQTLLDYMATELENGVKPYELQYKLAITNRLVDTELFAQGIKLYYKKVGKKKPYNVIKSNLNRLQKVNVELYNKLQNNCTKIEKFFDDIGI